MYRTAATFALKPGCYEEYKKAHDELWPDLARSMSDNDVNMAIYHHKGRLYMFATAPTQDHWERSRNVPILEKWSKYMATLMVTGADGKAVVEPMDEAFVFGEFAETQPGGA